MRANRGISRFATAVVLLCTSTAQIAAQELEPRQYSNAPVGMSILLAGFGASSGSVLFDPAVPLQNADVDVDAAPVGYARSLRLGPFSGRVSAVTARACISGSADIAGERRSRSLCGWTDASARLTVNFLGAPPLSLSEFSSFRQGFVFGGSLQVTFPTGRYDADRLLNIGTNRKAYKAEIGLSKAQDNWFLELALSGTFFETNHEYISGIRKQDPIMAWQGHAVRRLRSGRWIAIDATYYRGGRTETNGLLDGNLQSNARLGVTFSLPINAGQSLKLTASSGVSTRTGTDFDAVGAVWQFRFGGAPE
jgi:hypothetical protein